MIDQLLLFEKYSFLFSTTNFNLRTARIPYVIIVIRHVFFCRIIAKKKYEYLYDRLEMRE